jgi:restriction endonuclease Mrr
MKVRVPDTLRLPTQTKAEDELLKLLASRARPLSTNEAYRALADACDLTQAQRVARADGTRAEPAWHYRVRWAMDRIEKAGWARRVERGMWTATAQERKVQRARQQSGSKVTAVVDEDIFAGEGG